MNKDAGIEEAYRVQLQGMQQVVDELNEPDMLAGLLVGRLREDDAPAGLVRHAEELEAEVRRWSAE